MGGRTWPTGVRTSCHWARRPPLALSTEAVRKLIQRGTLVGEKVGGVWFVRVDQLPPGPASSLSSAVRQGEPVETASGGRPDPGRCPDGWRDVPGVDLLPLAELIERLTRANRDLAAATAM